MDGERTEERWTLADLADFELLLSEEGHARGARKIWQDRIVGDLQDDGDESSRRRRGLRRWLEFKREDRSLAGQKIESGLRLAGLLISVAMFLTGVGVVRGVLGEIPDGGGRGYNVWLLLAVTLGVQWLILLGGLAGGLLWRRHGGLSVAQELASFLGEKLAGSRVKGIWHQLIKTRAKGYGSVLGWRLGALTQTGAEWLNFGMLAGFLGCLWFLKIGFYWESTLDLDARSLEAVTRVLSFPWSFHEPAVPISPDISAISFAAPAEARESASRVWSAFFVLALLVWGLLPRIGLFAFCKWKEKRALAALEFQENRHRNLWREMAKVERTVVRTGQEDGVVLLDVGGSGVNAEKLRPFLLQRLRANPEGVFQTGVLDPEKERLAEEAMKRAALGVVLVVEGWNLSKPEMQANHERVRKAVGSTKPVRFLVVGAVRHNEVTEASDVEFAEWVKFVDSLRDPATEVVRWEE